MKVVKTKYACLNCGDKNSEIIMHTDITLHVLYCSKCGRKLKKVKNENQKSNNNNKKEFID